MGAQGGDKLAALGVPNNRCRVVSTLNQAGGFRCLYHLVTVLDGSHLPRNAGVGAEVQARNRIRVGRIHHLPFARSRQRGHGQHGRGGAPGQAGNRQPREGVIAEGLIVGAVNQGPGLAAIGRSKDAFAIVRVCGVVWIPCTRQDDRRRRGLDRHGTDGECGHAGGTLIC